MRSDAGTRTYWNKHDDTSLISETCQVIGSNLACEGVGCCRSSSRLRLGGHSCLITIRYSFKQPPPPNEVHPSRLFPVGLQRFVPPPSSSSSSTSPSPAARPLCMPGAERKDRRHRRVFAHTARGIETDGRGVGEGVKCFLMDSSNGGTLPPWNSCY